MEKHLISEGIARIRKQSLTHRDMWLEQLPSAASGEVVYSWLGAEQEDIMVDVYVYEEGQQENEPFHYHDFFYFIYLYKGKVNFLTGENQRLITVREDELFVGQPYAGIRTSDIVPDTIIINILIKKEMFMNTFLPIFLPDSRLMQFFTGSTAINSDSDCFHIHVHDHGGIHGLLNLIIVEYAFHHADKHYVLKPLTLAFVAQVARQYAYSDIPQKSESFQQKVYKYMQENLDSITLTKLAQLFSYHPSYLSSLIHKEFGKKFSELLQEMRMEKALILLHKTSLPVETIATMLGYTTTSGFYGAFKSYFHSSPRKYLDKTQRE